MDAAFATLNISQTGEDYPPCHPSLLDTPIIQSKKEKLGFLDLDAGTRNKIYKLLLLNRDPTTGDLHAVNIVDSPVKRKNGYGAFCRYIVGGDGCGFLFSDRVPSRERAKNGCDYIEPAILRTCKQIASEGKYILYTENVFAINLSRESIAPVQWFPRYQRSNFVSRILDPKYLGTDGKPEMRIPRYLSELTTVAFIQQIGPDNAAAIEHLELFATRSAHITRALPVITEIVKQYMTQLHTANFWLMSKNGDLKVHDREFYARPDVLDDFWLSLKDTEEWEPLQDRLHHWIEEIKTMDVFKYSGTWQLCWEINEEISSKWRDIMNETDAITRMVESRSRLREGNESQFRKATRRKEMVCPAVVNRQRLPEDKNWAAMEDSYGELDGKGGDCALGDVQWRPGQEIVGDGMEEIEFDDDEGTLLGASARYYSGGTVNRA